ncbi:hypothetical protein MVEN_00176100 [Mycena venus]|uniref:Uncharacterized protein n=1 Tax=Mycena venus TaxID=2733690 RepID=A0A8H6YXY9_9AGAR|nr:hypothetical protein MVEN_00176100 [Mycena venus]
MHRKLPDFCRSLAATPSMFFAPDAVDFPKRFTLDGEPFHDRNVFLAAQALAPQLPDLTRMISAMFSGAAVTWIRFTPEFAIDGPIDLIPRSILPKLYIPSTNDHNEGPLGSYRVHIRYHPNSTPESFSALERYRRNNTESFAAKYITAEDLLYVMREVRKEDASGANVAFRQAVVEELERKARVQREKVRMATEKKQKREELLRATGLEQDREKIRKMTVPQLKQQYDVYKLIIKDTVILKTTLVSIPRRQDKLDAVLAALERYQENLRTDVIPATSTSQCVTDTPEMDSDTEMVDAEGDEFADEAEEEELYH